MDHNHLLCDVHDTNPYVELGNNVEGSQRQDHHPHHLHYPQNSQSANPRQEIPKNMNEDAQLYSSSLPNQLHSSLTNDDNNDHHQTHHQHRSQQQQQQHTSMDHYTTPSSSFSSSKGQYATTNDMNDDAIDALTPSEIAQLRLLLARSNLHSPSFATNRSIKSNGGSMDSDYPEFGESTHAWAIFADHPQKRAGPWERVVGTLIIIFQLFAYRLFALEAVEDFQKGQVPVTISHAHCVQMGYEPNDDNNNHFLQCEAQFTNTLDALVAFFMLGIFLTGDMLQAGRAIRNAPPGGFARIFACLAGIEVVCAFLAASVAVSYHLFIGEVTDAVEVGVGLLFIRELSQQTYSGIRYGKTKQFRDFFFMLSALVIAGLILDPLTAKVFAGYIQ